MSYINQMATTNQKKIKRVRNLNISLKKEQPMKERKRGKDQRKTTNRNDHRQITKWQINTRLSIITWKVNG